MADKDKLEELAEKLKNGKAKFIGPFNMDDLPDSLKNIMEGVLDTDIIEMKASRLGVDVVVKHCTNAEAEDAAIEMIGNLLDLFPESHRNDILYKAIQIPESKKGKLVEDAEKNSEE